MATTVDRAFVHGYSQEVYRLVAQMDSRFRANVRVKTGVVGKTHNFERLGPSDLATVTARHQPTNILNPEHSRRQCRFTDKEGSILLDKFDEIKMIIQPKNQYAQNHAEAINRFWDDLIIAAMVGNSVAVDETDATSNVTLASYASGRQVIATGSLGLTFEKVNQVLRVFNQNEVPYGDRHFAVDSFGLEDLLAETEVGSSDFNNLRAIQNGEMQGRSYMSFQWHLSERLYQVIHSGTGTTHSALAWHQSGVGLAVALDMQMKVSERNDLAASPIQVQAFCSAGSVRIEEAKVVQVSYIE